MDKKLINKAFGRGGVKCYCCNPARAGRCRKSTKLMLRKKARNARKKAKKIALEDYQ